MQIGLLKRREFITLLGGAAAWPLTARAQQPAMTRVGILMPFLPKNAEMQARVRAFREGLRKCGWAAGVNVQFDERWTSDNMDLIRSAATNLVELKPDAILAQGARVIPILMELTRSIPVIVLGGAEPVARVDLSHLCPLAHSAACAAPSVRRGVHARQRTKWKRLLSPMEPTRMR